MRDDISLFPITVVVGKKTSILLPGPRLGTKLSFSHLANIGRPVNDKKESESLPAP